MVNEAKQYEEEDKKRKELVELKNKADGMIYSTEQTLKEHGDKIEPSKKDEIQQAIKALQESLTTDDAQAISSDTDKLTQLSMSIGEGMYKSGDQSQGGEEEKKDDKEKVIICIFFTLWPKLSALILSSLDASKINPKLDFFIL